jgi:hypothetical protein
MSFQVKETEYIAEHDKVIAFRADTENSRRSSKSSISAGQSMRFQPLLQQFNEHRSSLGLSLGGDLSNERLNCTFDQNAQDYVGVQADRTGHADGLSEDVPWVGSGSSNALNSTYEGLNGWKRLVWHIFRMAAQVPVTQCSQMFLICSPD